MNFDALPKEEREWFFMCIFGEWKERSELNAILFPNAKKKSSRSSSMSQLFNAKKGKSFGKIASALEVLFAVEPLAGATPHGRDCAADNEFKTDISKFYTNAKHYYRRFSRTLEVERIKMAAATISSLSEAAAEGNAVEKYRAIKTLWRGIVAVISNMHSISFPVMKNISEPLAQAVSSSALHCPTAQIRAQNDTSVELLRKVLSEKMVGVWKHALLGVREAKDSVRVYARLMDEKNVPAGLLDALCGRPTAEKIHIHHLPTGKTR